MLWYNRPQTPETRDIVLTEVHLGKPIRPTEFLSLIRNRNIAIAKIRTLLSATLTWPQSLSRIKLSAYLVSYILVAAIPSVSAVVYLAYVASDQYAAEARFAVRTAQTDVIGGGSLLASASGGGSIGGRMSALLSQIGLPNQDPYIVASYIHSRSIIDDLSKSIDLRAVFTRPGADFWARLKDDATVEELLHYWNGMVTTYVDGPSGIVTVTVRAFRAEDAVVLSQAVVEASEKLVNEVSARARNDAMKRAETDVRRYEEEVRQALFNLQKFRNGEGFIDPLSAATSTSKLLLGAMSEKIRLQSELYASSRAMSNAAPTVQNLKLRLEGVDRQITQLKSKLTGNSTEKTISNSLAKFEELELKRVFAEKLYAMAQDALERARVRAEQQNMYLSVFVTPSLPHDAKYPERLSLSVLIPISLTVIWGIFALIAAAVQDHRL